MAKKEGILVGIGPAMMNDGDDPAQAELLSQILSLTSQMRGSVVVGVMVAALAACGVAGCGGNSR